MANPIWVSQSALVSVIAIAALVISIINYSYHTTNIEPRQTSTLVQIGLPVNSDQSDIGFTSNYYDDQGVVYTTGFYRNYENRRYILFDELKTDSNRLKLLQEFTTSTLAGINVKNIQVSYGSLTEPSIWFGSRSTGIYAPDENSMNMVINGSNSVTVKDGKLGINNTSPSYALDVAGTCRITGAVTLDSTLSLSGSLGMTSLIIGGTTVIDSNLNLSNINNATITTLTLTNALDLSSLIIGGTTVIDSSLNMSNINNATIDNYLSLSYENVSSTTIDTDLSISLIGVGNSNSEFTLANGTAGVTKIIQSNKLIDIYIALEQATLLLNPVNPISNLVYTDKWNILNGQPIIKYQQGSKIVGTGYTGGVTVMGNSVALSADGNTMAFGGSYNNSGIGAVWVWTRSGSTWSEEKAAIVGTGYSGNAGMGSSVALSADGNTLAFSGRDNNSNIGAIWVWTRSGTTWTEQKAAIVGTGYTGSPKMGWSIALSADGNTLAFGGPDNDTQIGAVWVWTRSGTTWSEEKAAIVGTGYTGTPVMGRSVALSSDGNTLAFGGYFNNTQLGAVWVWTRSGTTWSEEKAAIVGTGYTGSTPRMGQSVALSADGNTLAFGGNHNNSTRGAVWIWTRSVTTWTEQRAALIGTSFVFPTFGTSISLSSDGSVLAVGGPSNNSSIGATWIFKRTNSIWEEQAAALVGTGYSGSPEQGTAVALSAKGTTLAVGSPSDNSYRGAIWIFK